MALTARASLSGRAPKFTDVIPLAEWVHDTLIRAIGGLCDLH
ncbi:hypothetical protein [Candidatus Methanocrinis natronophilus]|uniref:Uncharacterized protein n=1 Tax=Candidatus Methanocrinis natronophilus TaxID=3033396 RepID=A0ABT5X7Z7_9EURY|nr:hypothetical protein [Candidatus Methanocrinis natronophilus]MDF0590824.1 hypothetical protein [Candidatus Methanocrinis natronophilus]